MLVKISSFYFYPLLFISFYNIFAFASFLHAKSISIYRNRNFKFKCGILYKFRYCTLDCVITRTCAEVPNRSAGGLKQASQARAEESVEGASVEERLKVFLYETFSRFLPFIFMFRSKFSR